MNALFAKRVDLAQNIYRRIAEIEQIAYRGGALCYIYTPSDLRIDLGFAHLIKPGLYIYEGALYRLRQLFPFACIEEVRLETEPISSLVNLHSILCRG